jgi:hypothetical protein
MLMPISSSARCPASESADDLDQRRLARAVVAEQPEDLALAQVQVDVAQRRDRAEALGDVFDAQDVGVSGSTRWSGLSSKEVTDAI